jgi:hypothetical protein
MKPDISLHDIYNAINDFREEVRGTYVTKDEFAPIKLIVFGLVGSVLITVLGAVITTVVKAR